MSNSVKVRADLSLPNSLRGKHCRGPSCCRKISRTNKSGYCRICYGRFVLHVKGTNAFLRSDFNDRNRLLWNVSPVSLETIDAYELKIIVRSTC